jgi:hypothetical protein
MKAVVRISDREKVQSLGCHRLTIPIPLGVMFVDGHFYQEMRDDHGLRRLDTSFLEKEVPLKEVSWMTTLTPFRR